MLIVALFLISKLQGQLGVRHQMDKVNVQMRNGVSFIHKKNETMSFVVKLMEMEAIILSEIVQTHTNIMFSP